MAEFPALPLWTDAYLADTTHLTTLEHGAYLLLLMTAWRSKECALPNDDRLLAKYARLTPGQWKRVKPVLEPFFNVSSDGWRQGRLTDERVAVKQNSKKQSDKARSRWLKNKETDNAVAQPDLMPDECRKDAETMPPLPTPNISVPTELGETPDLKSEIFGPVLDWLAKKSGKRTQQLRPTLGKMCAKFGDGPTLDAAMRAQRESAVDPIGFMFGVLNHAKRDDSATRADDSRAVLEAVGLGRLDAGDGGPDDGDHDSPQGGGECIDGEFTSGGTTGEGGSNQKVVGLRPELQHQGGGRQGPSGNLRGAFEGVAGGLAGNGSGANHRIVEVGQQTSDPSGGGGNRERGNDTAQTETRRGQTGDPAQTTGKGTAHQTGGSGRNNGEGEGAFPDLPAFLDRRVTA